MQNLPILVGGDERDGKALGTEAAGTTDTVEIGIGIGGQVVVDGEVDPLDVNTTAKDIGSHTDALVELLEFLVPADAMLMSAGRMSIKR